MSPDDYLAPRPLSVAIPTLSGVDGPYCPRRPNLREILSNTSPPPWTLTAFMAYLSNNHCLETLEFTMDAGRYKKHYAKMMSRTAGGDPLPPLKDREYVQALWQRLVEAYIQPSGSREVNLPSSVKNPILNIQVSSLPPSPERLESAVNKIYELMEDSVLVPFLNSVYPQTAHPSGSPYAFGASDDNFNARTYEDRSFYAQRTRFRDSPPFQASDSNEQAFSNSSQFYRQSAPVPMGGLAQRPRISPRLSQSTSYPNSITSSGDMDAPLSHSGSGGHGSGMSDDSPGASSPTGEMPSALPTSHHSIHDMAQSKRDSGMWKKLGRLGGMKPGKKKSQGGLKYDED